MQRAILSEKLTWNISLTVKQEKGFTVIGTLNFPDGLLIYLCFDFVNDLGYTVFEHRAFFWLCNNLNVAMGLVCKLTA